jgi:hypothetical protein
MSKKLKNEIKSIISGKSKVRFGTTIQAVANHLSESTFPSTKIENSKQYKQQ